MQEEGRKREARLYKQQSKATQHAQVVSGARKEKAITSEHLLYNYTYYNYWRSICHTPSPARPGLTWE